MAPRLVHAKVMGSYTRTEKLRYMMFPTVLNSELAYCKTIVKVFVATIVSTMLLEFRVESERGKRVKLHQLVAGETYMHIGAIHVCVVVCCGRLRHLVVFLQHENIGDRMKNRYMMDARAVHAVLIAHVRVQTVALCVAESSCLGGRMRVVTW